MIQENKVKKYKKILDNEIETRNKYYELFYAILEWLEKKIDGEKLGSKIFNSGYRRVAVYGMGRLGRCLVDELSMSEVRVLYGIDIRGKELYYDIPIFMPSEELGNVDAVIVTVSGSIEQIKKILRKKMDCPILSLGDIIR